LFYFEQPPFLVEWDRTLFLFTTSLPVFAVARRSGMTDRRCAAAAMPQIGNGATNQRG